MKPPIEFVAENEMVTLGELTADAVAWDKKLQSESGEFIENDVRNLRNERELELEGQQGDRYSTFQPQGMPVMSSLVGKRIDVYSQYDVKDCDGSMKQVRRWCQGKVLFVSDESAKNIREFLTKDPISKLEKHSWLGGMQSQNLTSQR